MSKVLESISDLLRLVLMKRPNVPSVWENPPGKSAVATDTSSENVIKEFPPPISPSNTMDMLEANSDSSHASSAGRRRTRKSTVDCDGGDNDKSRFSIKLWCLAHRIEVLAVLLVITGIIVVILSAAFASRDRNGDINSNEDALEPSPTYPAWPGYDSTVTAPRPPGGSSSTEPNGAPSGPISSSIPAPAPSPGNNPVMSLFDEISNVVADPQILRQSDTPQGQAFDWLSNIDERITNQYGIAQRFALATFYFATGGKRTIAAWKYCSAVPTTTTDAINSFSTRCIFEEGRHVCAEIEDFVECPEYEDMVGATILGVPPKRWLSIAHECDWYGITCDDDGRVEQINLHGNGLEGTLVRELRILKNLKSLLLPDNNLIGKIPEWSSAADLEQQSQRSNNPSDVISVSWSFDNLQTLDLSQNSLTGSTVLPIGSLSLRSFNTSENPELEVQMTPHIGLWVDLETFDISTNKVVGQVPGTIGNWKSLQSLRLSNCQIAGHMFPEISAMPDLGEFF